MTAPNFEQLQIGDALPAFTTAPISRTTLALFAGASGDHNPIHIDIDFARKAGMQDVFAHGMLSMAYLAQLLTNWVPQQAIRSYSTRFLSITNLQDEITCQGTVAETWQEDGLKLVKITLTAINQDQDIKLAGEAIIAL